MTRPTVPAPAPGDLRDTLTIWLMACDECIGGDKPADYVEHHTRFLAAGRDAVHSGDCTKESHACIRCVCDTYLGHADALLAGPLKPYLAAEATIAARTAERDEARDVAGQLQGSALEAEHWADRALAAEAQTQALQARVEGLEAALKAATANLTGAASAYRRHASRHLSVGRAIADPFFTTRAADFEKAADAAHAALDAQPTEPVEERTDANP